MTIDSYLREICLVQLNISLNSGSTFILNLRFTVNLSSLSSNAFSIITWSCSGINILTEIHTLIKSAYQHLQRNLCEVAYFLLSLAYSYRCQHAGEPSQVSGAPSIFGFAVHEPEWHPSASAPTSIHFFQFVYCKPLHCSSCSLCCSFFCSSIFN